MTDKERLGIIKENKKLFDTSKSVAEFEQIAAELLLAHGNWLIEQAERVEELEKERSEWKGKYSILKNKYRALQRKMKNKWRYNRALENESRTNEIVLEEFREENKRYREVIEDIKKTSDDYRAGHLLDIQDSFFVDEII